MTKIHLRLPLLVAIALSGVTGCAQMNRPARAAPSEAVPAKTARIYVAFPQSLPWSDAYVTEGKTLLGYLRNNQHIAFDVPAGEHTFIMRNTNHEEAISGEFLGGKTYHLRAFLTPGAFGGRMYWKPLKSSGEDLEARRKDISETTHVELNPDEAREWEQDESDDNEEYAAEFSSGEEKPVTFSSEHAL